MLSANACFWSSSSESKLSLIKAWKRRARALVPRCEDVVGGEHDRLWRGGRVPAPRAQDGVPGHASGNAVGGKDGLDRLAAARLENAQLGDSSQLLLSGRPSLASGR